MKHEEAKFILNAYRPNGADAADPAFAEALEHARRDPALAAWFERLNEFDRAVAAKLGEVQPPSGLRETILAGARVGTPEGLSWWRRPAWLAVAAAFIVVGAVTLSLAPARLEAADLTSFVARDAQQRHMHGDGEAWSSFQARLAEPATRLGQKLAVNFSELRTTGCRTIRFQGRDVLEVCFNRDGKWYHCYVVRRADFPSLQAPASAEISAEGSVHVATWADDSHLFVVVSKGGAEALQVLL
ncbi:MAG TPA: hypothetical protein VEB66_06700 [Opitutaceae bacterium]|nr:hypothetical protein [Opitutaceae bacterium]